VSTVTAPTGSLSDCVNGDYYTKRKGSAMKIIIISLLGSFVILSMASAQSFAETDGPLGHGGKGCHEEGMPMMPPDFPATMHPGKDMMGGPGAMPFALRLFSGLDLNEKQKDAIKEIESKVIKDAIRKGAEIEIAELEVMDALDKDSADLTAVEVKLKKIESLRTELRFAHVKAVEEIKSKITPDQKKKLREILEAGPGLPLDRKERPSMH
jgi:Spy/CpxP family protein refolding chaperone